MRFAVVFIALAVLAATGVVALQGALADAGDRTVVEDESFTPQTGTAVALDRSNLGDTVYYDDNVSVVDENGDRSYNGTDYIWYSGNGTIEGLAGGNLDGDTTATITYAYRETTSEQRQLTALVSQIPRSMSYLLPLGLALAAIFALRGLI